MALKRISRTVMEMERKTRMSVMLYHIWISVYVCGCTVVHLAAISVPFAYHVMLAYVKGFTKYHASIIASVMTGLWIIADVLRVNIPWVRENFPLTCMSVSIYASITQQHNNSLLAQQVKQVFAY